MTSETKWVEAGGERLFCRVDRPEPESPLTALLLHGGGPAAGEQFQYLAEVLVSEGFGVVRFDHSGQGKSTGILKASSLARRAEEARAVVGALGVEVRVLVATSMAGGLMADLVPEWNPETLILFCPACYAADAWALRFDQGFTERIRTPDSWRESLLVDRLAGFRGDALLVRGDRDDVIPPGVLFLWAEALAGARSRATLLLEGCPHSIHRWVAGQPPARSRIVQAVGEVLRRSSSEAATRPAP